MTLALELEVAVAQDLIVSQPRQATEDAPPFELEQAVRSVMAPGSYFSPAIAQRLLQPSEPTIDDELTQRQIENLRLIAQGRASEQIAFELGLSPKTVDVHRARIMERLRLNDIASLTLYAGGCGGCQPPASYSPVRLEVASPICGTSPRWIARCPSTWGAAHHR